jgi:hypothetical protein
LKNQIKSAAVILDQATCHSKAIFETSIQNIGVELIYLPARMTS